MNYNPYILIPIIYVLGFISGMISCLILNRKGFKLDKVISLLFVGLWAGLKTVEMFSEFQVSWTLDMIGFGSAGHIIGLDLGELFNKFKK